MNSFSCPSMKKWYLCYFCSPLKPSKRITQVQAADNELEKRWITVYCVSQSKAEVTADRIKHDKELLESSFKRWPWKPNSRYLQHSAISIHPPWWIREHWGWGGPARRLLQAHLSASETRATHQQTGWLARGFCRPSGSSEGRRASHILG